MKNVIEILNKTQFGALATIEEGEPRVRPFQIQFEEHGRFYFCTSKEKEVAQQLIKNPFAEFTAFDKGFNYVRIFGEIKFCSELKLKEKVLKMNPFFKELFNSVLNENMLLFYYKHGRISFGNYNVYPPETFKF